MMTSIAAKLGSASMDATRSVATISILRKIVHAAARLLFGQLLPRVPYPVVRGPLRGCWYILGATAGDAGGVSVHLGVQEVEQTRSLTGLLKLGQIFFDVGANVGFYTLLASRIVGSTGRTIAFEPSPRNIAYLRRHVALNKAANVTIVPVACADQTGIELFRDGENNALGHLVDAADERDYECAPRASLVATLALDKVAEKLHVVPDVIKIDVEGAELRVLHGAASLLTDVRPTVLLSTHSDELRDSCLLYLRNIGYTVDPLNGDSAESATEFLARSIAA